MILFKTQVILESNFEGLNATISMFLISKFYTFKIIKYASPRGRQNFAQSPSRYNTGCFLVVIQEHDTATFCDVIHPDT